MATAATALAVLNLVGCGSGADESRLPPDQLANTIERLHEERPPAAQPEPFRLARLQRSDVPAGWLAAPRCLLEKDGGVLLVAVQEGAAARADGRPVRLAIGGPVAVSGGYFTGPGVTISIGRHAMVAERAEMPGARYPAGVTVAGRADRLPQRFEALWSCIR